MKLYAQESVNKKRAFFYDMPGKAATQLDPLGPISTANIFCKETGEYSRNARMNMTYLKVDF